MGKHALERECEEDDSGDHRQVEVAVGVARERERETPLASESFRSATSATTSKYAHQSAAATAMPRTAAVITPASSSPRAPTPIAMIDSPRAMMMMSP